MDTKGLEDDLKQRMVTHGEWERCVPVRAGFGQPASSSSAAMATNMVNDSPAALPLGLVRPFPTGCSRILRVLTDRLGASGWEETVKDQAARTSQLTAQLDRFDEADRLDHLAAPRSAGQARSMDPLNLDKLLAAMSPSAQGVCSQKRPSSLDEAEATITRPVLLPSASVPAEIRKEVEGLIRDYLERNIE